MKWYGSIGTQDSFNRIMVRMIARKSQHRLYLSCIKTGKHGNRVEGLVDKE